MLNQYEDILTIFELAEILKIGNTQAYRLVRTGKIKAFKSGKDWKIPKQTVIQYICELLGSGGIDHPKSLRINHF